MQYLRKILWILIVFLSIFSIGCQRYQGYNFSVERNPTDFGGVKAKLQGSKSDWIFFAKHDSPYDLWIWFEFDELETAEIIIEELLLIDSTSSKVILKKSGIRNQYSAVDSSDGNYSYIRIEKIQLEYKDYDLQIKYKIISKGMSSEYVQKFLFKKKYEAFWQTLIST
jgi:hypothetical protein